MDDGRWTMDDGRWTMDDGRWTMDEGTVPDEIGHPIHQLRSCYNYSCRLSDERVVRLFPRQRCSHVAAFSLVLMLSFEVP
ncbi:hypothetical protein B0T09DRAFT_337141 [Sordaria sp. MPI-SDFR-AT-0083]|nr:hypothetical protein B0T09DRAFT_337141 [Sordaria sp. MPI-SDFR-AT-0083]